MVYEIQTIIRLMIETWMIVLWMIVSYPILVDDLKYGYSYYSTKQKSNVCIFTLISCNIIFF